MQKTQNPNRRPWRDPVLPHSCKERQFGLCAFCIRFSRQKGGFSVVEFIVVLGIVLIVTMAMTRFSGDVISLNRVTQEGLRAQEELRKTLSGIAGELRNAQTSARGSYSIESAATSTIVFYSDTTGDRVPERLRYFVDGESFKRGTTIPSGAPLVYAISSETVSLVVGHLIATTTPIFTYYDGSYTGSGEALSSPLDISKVRMVGISLAVDKDPNEPPEPVTARTSATVRELKDNL